jgi:hypothetical protein
MEANPDPFAFLDTSNTCCFLCGNNTRISKEHVFPKWLQNKHDLWDQKLILLNNSGITYKQLVIPCCEDCNTRHLSRLEGKIKNALDLGYLACLELTDLEILQWMGKLYLGTISKEVTLALDRQAGNGETIFPKELLDRYMILHLLLQSIRRPLTVSSAELPYSVFVVNLLSSEYKDTFYFRDSISHLVASFRSGSVGFIVAFEDGSLGTETYGKYLEDVAGRKLHPIQFDELYTKILYQNSLFIKAPKFISIIPMDETRPISISMLPFTGMSSLPLLEDWSQEEYAKGLSEVMQSWVGETAMADPSFFTRPNLVRTWLTDSNGNLAFFNEL